MYQYPGADLKKLKMTPQKNPNNNVTFSSKVDLTMKLLDNQRFKKCSLAHFYHSVWIYKSMLLFISNRYDQSRPVASQHWGRCVNTVMHRQTPLLGLYLDSRLCFPNWFAYLWQENQSEDLYWKKWDLTSRQTFISGTNWKQIYQKKISNI